MILQREILKRILKYTAQLAPNSTLICDLAAVMFSWLWVNFSSLPWYCALDGERKTQALQGVALGFIGWHFSQSPSILVPSWVSTSSVALWVSHQGGGGGQIYVTHAKQWATLAQHLGVLCCKMCHLSDKLWNWAPTTCAHQSVSFAFRNVSHISWYSVFFLNAPAPGIRWLCELLSLHEKEK